MKLGSFLAYISRLPLALHQRIASFCLASLDYPLTTESGAITLSCNAVLNLWYKAITCIHSEEEARQYEVCSDRMYQMACDEGDTNTHSWWVTFWGVLVMKYPNVAADHIPQFLHEVIDRKQTLFVAFLPVSGRKRFSTHVSSLFRCSIPSDQNPITNAWMTLFTHFSLIKVKIYLRFLRCWDAS